MAHSSASGFGQSPALPSIAVLVVDDQQAVREGLARLIACAPLALRAIETAAQGTDALRTSLSLRPDVVILDADLSGEDGLALIPLLAPAAVLVLTCHGDRSTRERALRLGARAFVEKHQPAADLLDALVLMVGPQTRGEEAPAHPGASTHRVAVASSAAQ
jgi:two-component system nitrate/nitrite response regulator NarL